MNFADFIKSLPKQEDKYANQFIDFVKKDAHFPATSEPSKLAIYLYLRLNTDLTLAFQKLLMLYSHMPFNQLPKKWFGRQDMPLMAINIIVTLQNFDEEYKFN